MLAKYWQAAIVAATVALAVNPAWAEDRPASSSGACAGCACPPGQRAATVPQTNDSTWAIQAACSLYQTALNTWACEHAGGCGSTGARECKECKECCKGTCDSCCACCPAKDKHAKKTTVAMPIVVVVPMPMPMTPHPVPVCMPMPPTVAPPAPAACMLAPPPPMPPQSLAVPPPPPGYPCPHSCPTPCLVAETVRVDPSIDFGVTLLGMAADLCCSRCQPFSLTSLCMSMLGMAADLCGQAAAGETTYTMPCDLPHPPPYVPPSPPLRQPWGSAAQQAVCAPEPLPPPPPVVTCGIATAVRPAPSATMVCIAAEKGGGHLQMSIGDGACMSCQEMSVKMGDRSLQLAVANGEVHVRTERAPELKARAKCVRTDRKECLILEGDVELSYCNGHQHAKVSADCIELNLTTGTVTIKSASALERLGVNFP